MATTSGRRSIVSLMTRPLRAQFACESWANWHVLVKAIFGLPLAASELETFRALTGRSVAPSSPVREAWLVVGRRAGKSIIAALVAVYLTTCRSYRLAAGERGVFMIIAADRRQARVVRGYIGGLLHGHPSLEALIETERRESIDLTTGISIEVHTASFRTIRGYTVVGAVLDELAFWPTDDAANPDAEILTALRPAMATVPEALLLCLSSPYSRRGELYKAHRAHYGRDDDPVLVVQAATRTLNPTVPQAVIDRAYADDEFVASAEYGAQFRRDVESVISAEVLEAVTVPGRFELPPVEGTGYVAFTDPAGGSGSDAMTLAIAHVHDRRAVLDLLREVRPPFSPDATVADFVALLRRYRVAAVWGDRYGGEWPREQFRTAGVAYETSEGTKSAIYRDTVPLLNSGQVELLDHRRLRAQLAALERRTARGGRDSIDHAPGGRDDVANSCCGALVLAHRAAVQPRELRIFPAGFWPIDENDPDFRAAIARAEAAYPAD